MRSRAVSAIDHSIDATLSLEGSSSIAEFPPTRAKRALLCMGGTTDHFFGNLQLR